MPMPSSASAGTATTRTSRSAFTPGVSQAAAVGSGPDAAGDRAQRATGDAGERRGELAGVDVRAVGRLPEPEDVCDTAVVAGLGHGVQLPTGVGQQADAPGVGRAPDAVPQVGDELTDTGPRTGGRSRDHHHDDGGHEGDDDPCLLYTSDAADDL